MESSKANRRVVDAVHRICDPAPDGLGISQRSVTVSTVGLTPAIRKLADERLQVTLAVSLHAPVISRVSFGPT